MFASRTNWSLEPNRLTQALEERRRRGLPVFDLTESNPTRCGFTYDTEQILGALRDPRALKYEPDARGLLSARQAVVHYYALRGVEVRPEQIFLTTSTSEAYTFVFRLLANPGDQLLAPQPSYPLFDFLVGLSDVEIVPYPLSYDQHWQIDLSALEAAVGPRARAILAVHPNNPTGSFVTTTELDFLKHCWQKGRLAIVADEVFADYPLLPPGMERVTSFASAAGALTFTLSGLSKISALPQMKVAWVVVNGPVQDLEQALGRLEVIADTYLSLSAPAALALPAWLESRQGIQMQIRKRLRSNLNWLDSQLGPGAPVCRLKVEGGWYVILKILSENAGTGETAVLQTEDRRDTGETPAVRTDDDWVVEWVEKEGVLVHPGHFYDFPEDGFFVASLLTPPEVFKPSLEKILRHLANVR
ncbi:MAG: pyridoxal phosphate-dependent aminotransferase [Acidobacteriia bacterium]|nr:pyridoxal phosphate-dependent aminotransferase [Terriglobia bacterium]